MEFIINELEKNISVISNLLNSVNNEMISWRPQQDKWCMLEIVCHLYDEEREDFRFRTKWVLENPGQIPPPFNPLDWIETHQYMQQDYVTMIEKLLVERKQSISWLRSLKNPNWASSYDHEKIGTTTAKHYLANWLAHDYLHIRQITKLKFDYLKSKSGENLDYAGIW
jgi:hypothetical protein